MSGSAQTRRDVEQANPFQDMNIDHLRRPESYIGILSDMKYNLHKVGRLSSQVSNYLSLTVNQFNPDTLDTFYNSAVIRDKSLACMRCLGEHYKVVIKETSSDDEVKLAEERFLKGLQELRNIVVGESSIEGEVEEYAVSLLSKVNNYYFFYRR